MWITGFDVPSCSTIYLDKPMKNHTLMQTIARANRVFPEKNNGLIVDYVGVFRDLQAALAIYAKPVDGDEGALPVKDKAELIEWLRAAVDNAVTFCRGCGVDVDGLLAAAGFDLIAAGETAVELLLVDDQTKSQFITRARLVDRLFKAILPDPVANEFGPIRARLRLSRPVDCIAQSDGGCVPRAGPSGSSSWTNRSRRTPTSSTRRRTAQRRRP